MRCFLQSLARAAQRAERLYHALDGAGVGISMAECKEGVAMALGWGSWHEMSEDMADDTFVPSLDPRDQDAATTVRFHVQVVDALMQVTGLPPRVADSLAATLDIMADPGNPPRPLRLTTQLREFYGERAESVVASSEARVRGEWYDPEGLDICLCLDQAPSKAWHLRMARQYSRSI